MGECRNIFTSKRWEPTNIKEKSQYDNLPLNFSTGAIEDPVTKIANKADLKTHHSGKNNDSSEESSTKSVESSHKCGKNFHIKRYFKYNRNGSDGN